MKHGRYFDDFEPGQTFSHWPGRTVTEADDIWFSLLTQNQNPLHIDAHYAATRGPHHKPLVNGTLVFSIAVGQTVSDISPRHRHVRNRRQEPAGRARAHFSS